MTFRWRIDMTGTGSRGRAATRRRAARQPASRLPPASSWRRGRRGQPTGWASRRCAARCSARRSVGTASTSAARIGVGNSDTDFSNSTHDFVAYSLRETVLGSEQSPQDWNVLQSDIQHGQSYGGFIGYNVQWDSVVISGELAYNRASGFNSSASDSIARVVSISTGTDTVTIAATNSHQAQRLRHRARARRLCLRTVSALWLRRRARSAASTTTTTCI